MKEKLVLKNQMCSSSLILRLEKPIEHPSLWFYGGGLKKYVLSIGVMCILDDIFFIDGIDFSDPDWGALPTVLDFIANQSTLNAVVSGETQGVFYICPKSYEIGVITIIKSLLEDESSLRLKKYCGLFDRINHPHIYNEDIVGWLELDNGFFFFIDKDMFEKTKKLFEVP